MYFGHNTTRIQGIAIDAAGYVYATGGTGSEDFPATSGAFQTIMQGDNDAFVTKFSPDGSSLVYSTFVGGSAWEQGLGICIDEQGNAYVAGIAASADSPVISGAAQGAYDGDHDAFVLKLSVDGSALVYSTYLGGSSQDGGVATALQDTSAAFLTIVSEDGTSFIFPTT